MVCCSRTMLSVYDTIIQFHLLVKRELAVNLTLHTSIYVETFINSFELRTCYVYL